MQDLVIIKNQHAVTTSLKVAEKFNKQHKNILRDIQALECSENFRQLNFEQSSYTNSQGKNQPMYEITRDGFVFLAMGFTGKKAARFKEDYIAAFNAMEQAIIQQQNLDWQKTRKDGKYIRRKLTDEIQVFIDYATAQGSKSASTYYMNISKMTNKALFLIGQKASKDFRNMLDFMQLTFLQAAEFVARNALKEGMAQNMHYKDIYKYARDKVTAYAIAVGQTSVPSQIPNNHKQLT